MTKQKSNFRVLGLSFIAVGIGLTVSLSIPLGPAFMGIGLPFVVLGIIFLGRGNGAAETEGAE